MNHENFRVVMLCGNGQSSRIMYHGLANELEIVSVVLEDKPSSKVLLQRRMKKLGIIKVGGQVAFMLLNKLLARVSKSKIKRLISQYELNDQHIPDEVTTKVSSVNCEETLALLKQVQPDVVVVNGTRIISKKLLSSIDAPFINTHMGITPRYRGVHGGYWALARKDAEHCGVTVHLVDEGIDTGGVLYQDMIQPGRGDSFNTYPVHQIAKAIPLMKAALDDVENDRLNVQQGVQPSNLWYHPTLFEYVKNFVLHGVR